MSLTLIAFGRTAASRYHYNSTRYDYDHYGSWRLLTADTEVLITDGPLRRSDPDNLPLGELWDAFTAARPADRADSRFSRSSPWPDAQAVFPDYLRLLGATRDVAFCWDCTAPEWADSLCSGMGRNDILVCASCLADWPSCTSCENPFPSGELTGTLDDERICGNCRNDYYSFCGHCQGYYRYGPQSAGEHEHPPVPCCSSPQPEFTIRNDGGEPLASDTPVTVTLPEGVISDEGLQEIRQYLYREAGLAFRRAVTDDERLAADALQNLSYSLEQLGSNWQTPRGNYTKRLSSHAYRNKIKIAPPVLSQVGCIARNHSKSASVTIDVTRQLNRNADYFHNAGSCWWGSPGGYADSRCALKTNGGFGMRSLSPRYGEPTGRAWVMPLRLDRQQLTPTFETLAPDAFVVFNGYGELSGYTAPRILASMAGWTYTRVSDFECQPMYVNAGGYLVAPHDTVQHHKELYLSVPRHSNLYEQEQTEARLTARLNPEDKESAHVS